MGEAMELQLSGELEMLKTQLNESARERETLRAEKEQEREKRKNTEKELRQVVERQTASTSSQDQVEKDELNQSISNLKSKVLSLQVDLDNSVAVQNDFVRLSQSLQVELEKIRQAEKEVRWQHEEDVDDCGSCRAPFSVTKRASL